jgi:hypothetical protein
LADSKLIYWAKIVSSKTIDAHMKTTANVIACSFALTLGLYVIGYYSLPSPPSAMVVVVLAGIAVVAVLAARLGWSKIRARKTRPMAILLISLLLAFSPTAYPQVPPQVGKQKADALKTSPLCHLISGPMEGVTLLKPEDAPVGQTCEDGAGSSGVVVSTPILEDGESANCYLDRGPKAGKVQRSPEPSPIGSPCQDGVGSNGVIVPSKWSIKKTTGSQVGGPSTGKVTSSDEWSVRKASGTMPLMRRGKEEPGYGLYSYALLAHAPEDRDLPRYRAFIRALLELPMPNDIALSMPRYRINATYLPVTSIPSSWDEMPPAAQTEFVLYHYDYARSAAMLAGLATPIGDGPILFSALVPWQIQEHPHPFLVQDLSKAQPELMAAYIKCFIDQVAKPQFWVSDRLEALAVKLENLLVITAGGIGMSRDAILVWLRLAK